MRQKKKRREKSTWPHTVHRSVAMKKKKRREKGTWPHTVHRSVAMIPQTFQ